LNDLINRNIMQLKSKKEEKVVVAEDVIKVLEEQRNSNETALQTTLKELQRLKGKEGELKEEEYHLTLDQRIAETKTAFTEISKAITKLKL
jgi:predicted PilT family ATPase